MRGFKASGECRVLKNDQSSLGYEAQFRTRRAGNFLLYIAVPAHVLTITTKTPFLRYV